MSNNLLLKKEDPEFFKGDFFTFFTKEKDFLSEYDDVRVRCYSEIKGLPNTFDKNEFIYDQISHQMVVTYKDVVIGGGRIVGKFPGDTYSLPLESDEIKLPEIFPEFNLDKNPYCEFTRLSLLKRFRGLDMLQIVVKDLISFSIARGYRYLFSVSPLSQARRYKQTVRALEFPYEYNIHKNYEVPDKKGKYGELKVCIASLELPQKWDQTENRRYIFHS